MLDFFIDISIVDTWAPSATSARALTVAEKTLRQNDELHPHPFVLLTADDRTQNLIFPRFSRRDQGKFLHAGFKLQVPAAHLVMVLGAKQGKSMDRAIAVPGLAFARDDAQQNRLTGLDRDFCVAHSGHLEMAVLIGQHFNHARLPQRGQRRGGEDSKNYKSPKSISDQLRFRHGYSVI